MGRRAVEETAKRKEKVKFHFTKAALQKVACPPGQKCVYVYDAHTPTLCARVTPAGTVTFLFSKKVKGVRVRKNLTWTDGERKGSVMRLDTASIDEARKAALAEHGDAAKRPEKYLEGVKGVAAHEITLEKAFEYALEHSPKGRASDLGKRDWDQARDKFLNWMKAHYAHVRTWAELRRDQVTAYKKSLKPTAKSIERGKTKLSDTRLRLLMQPIVQTGNYMLTEHQIANVTQNLGLSAKLSKKTASVYLVDVLNFLDFLRDQQLYSLEAGAALQGLAGLQLLEALRLTWSKVDFKRKLVEISGEVKNEFRNRVIPIHKRCIEALERAHKNRTVKQVQELSGGYVVTSPSGEGFIDVSWQNYSVRLGKAIRAWNPKVDWAPKDLRNCLFTLGRDSGFAGSVLEEYCGHAAQGVTQKHYTPRLGSATEGEAEQLEYQMGIFRKIVVDNIEAKVKEIRAKKGAKAAVVNVAPAESES